jgi:hypothetical protein
MILGNDFAYKHFYTARRGYNRDEQHSCDPCRHIIIKRVDLLEIGLNVADWIGSDQDRYRWRALVNSVMNLRVP